jgi:hypothetical protein
MSMAGVKITTMRFDDEIYEKAMALARANFRKPSGEGNLAILIRSLIQQAYAHPERFGLQEPANEPRGEKSGD